MNGKYIEVRAMVRYWEDTYVNGVADSDGTLIPCRERDMWVPVIRMEDGKFMDWPEGKEAEIHYKICDAGEYWLLDKDMARIAKWGGYYVPNDILCVMDNGYGDYIIMDVGGDGKIKEWSSPQINAEEWAPVTRPARKEQE